MKKKKGQSRFFVLLSIVLAIAAGTSYYFERQNLETDYKIPGNNEQPSRIDPTRDWKSHTNKTYNFSIKYPKEWQRLTDLEKSNSVLYVGVKDTVDAKKMPKGIEVIIQKNPGGTKSMEYANKIVSKLGLGKDSKIYPSDFAEIDATVVEDLKDNPSPRAFISGRGIMLEIRSHSLAPDQDKQLFKQILYTFRLISS